MFYFIYLLFLRIETTVCTLANLVSSLFTLKNMLDGFENFRDTAVLPLLRFESDSNYFSSFSFFLALISPLTAFAFFFFNCLREQLKWEYHF